MKFHPIADLFPLIEGVEFGALVSDIRANGLFEPIVVLDDMILDGRNRYRACVEAGVEPQFVPYRGDDPLKYVVSLNLHRRHLSESQRAMVAARIATLAQGRPGKAANLPDIPTQADAADLLNVSERTVRSARTVLKDGAPELIASVDRGEVPVSRAEKIVRGTQGTGDNEWYTPDEFLDAARIVLGGFDLDPASSVAAQDSVEAGRYFTVEDDGLQQDWHGRVWLNPPYAQPLMGQFVSKLVAERRAGRVTAAIMLTHNYSDTAWFHEALGCADAICFTRGRVRFVKVTGEIASPTQGQVFFYFGDDVERFAQVFVQVGFVLPMPECFQSVSEEIRLAA